MPEDPPAPRAAARHRRPPAEPFRLVARLWVVEGEESAFRRFEDRALEIMREHGARMVSIERPAPSGPDTPYEVHVLEFPSRASFESYRADARLVALAALRERAVRRTELGLPDPARVSSTQPRS